MGETSIVARQRRLPAESARRRRRWPGSGWRDRHFAAIAVLPSALIMAVIFGLPLLVSLDLSFRGWGMDQELFGGTFVGFDNYQDLLSDPDFRASLAITLVYTAGAVIAEMALGLGLALLLNADLKLIGLFRTVLVVPMMMTPIVAAACWKLLLDPSHGIVDWLIGRPVVWLGAPGTARIAVGFVNVWQNAPYVAILLLAGLRSLPHEPLEAAAIDGASAAQRFWHVTLPLMRPYIMVALLLRTIFEFRTFDNVYVLTNGGPANATMVLSLFTYMASFVRYDLSLGAAASWLMVLISLGLCLAFIALIRRGRRP